MIFTNFSSRKKTTRAWAWTHLFARPHYLFDDSIFWSIDSEREKTCSCLFVYFLFVYLLFVNKLSVCNTVTVVCFPLFFIYSFIKAPDPVPLLSFIFFFLSWLFDFNLIAFKWCLLNAKYVENTFHTTLIKASASNSYKVKV